MRRRKQELPVGEAVAILRRGTSGVLALAGDGSYPYAVPMSYAYDGEASIAEDEAESEEIERFWNALLMFELRIEHLSGKETVELVRERKRRR